MLIMNICPTRLRTLIRSTSVAPSPASRCVPAEEACGRGSPPEVSCEAPEDAASATRARARQSAPQVFRHGVRFAGLRRSLLPGRRRNQFTAEVKGSLGYPCGVIRLSYE